ncbi:MAG: hypothetical protein ACD_71C00056G0002 [uncultured bacterium (gcode 4)]|uniref:Uncharacterized protein n=1 Tax=uncultured bacterium (gcode 4) TaxID=1234023 RepID=K1Z5B8_9BACT|nr:MAG: hypothetical protein ACD_71C00056G0002 [uncultured bacterium (gcode 4)]
MENFWDHQFEKENSLSSKVKKYVNIFSLSALLIMSWGDSSEIISHDDSDILGISSLQGANNSSELKYYYIQQKEWLIKAIEERYKNSKIQYPKNLLKAHEDAILYYSTDILNQENTDTLTYILTEDRIKKIWILKESIIWLMATRYSDEYVDVHKWIKILQEGVGNPDYKLVIKFIKWKNWEYSISNISVIPNKKEEAFYGDDEAEDLCSSDGVA